MAAKRSPILGYNHNVRYRGLVFHVQTEDSGVMSPHMFTHLFHEGVIVSTRKLVYDAGSDEGAIKSLMQAQHKAVLKDLKRGSFDDKIDQYLGGTPGLLPREGAGGSAPGTPEEVPTDATTPVAIIPPSESSDPPGVATMVDLAEVAITAAPTIADAGPSIPATQTATLGSPPPTPPRAPTPAAAPARAPTPATFAPIPAPSGRTPSGTHRASAAMAAVEPPGSPPMEPPPPQDDPPTLTSPPMSLGDDSPRAFDRPSTEPPEIEIQLEVDDDRDEPVAPHRRAARDTDISPFASGSPVTGLADVIPRSPTPSVTSVRESRPSTADLERSRVPSDSVSPLDKRVHASSLPPIARPITRPPRQPAVVTPAVVSRPMTGGDDSTVPGGDSAPIEVYAPPPSAMADPPGASLLERPGQYSLRRSQRVDAPSVPALPRGGSAPGVPVRSTGSMRAQPDPSAPPTTSRTETPPIRPDLPRTRQHSEPPRTTAQMTSQSGNIPTGTGTEPYRRPIITPADVSASAADARRGGGESRSEPPRRPSNPTLGRTPTPTRVTPPSVARTKSSSMTGASGSGVVMTRPAVIVGAPMKQTMPRVRKASEENRGFGQGLISEKSLDEVILAYLSEDAEEK